MVEQTPTPSTGTGDGASKKPPNRIEMYTILIPLLATSLILPMWNMYLANKTEIARVKSEQRHQLELEEIKAGQVTTHAELKEVSAKAAEVADKADTTAAKVEEIHQTTSAIAGSLPPSPVKQE